MGPNPVTDAFARREKPGHRKIHRGEGHVKTEAEVGTRHLHTKKAKGCQKPQKLGRGEAEFFSRDYGRN